MTRSFDRYDRSQPSRDAAVLTDRDIPEGIRSHRSAPDAYAVDQQLQDAINVALALGAPLLLGGEPGTGKTQLARHLAAYFGVPLFEVYVTSMSRASDLTYSFDAVEYLRAANAGERKPRGECIIRGRLWDAYLHSGPTIVLLDEIDKAPRDFPNDLLNVLDQHWFHVTERNERVENQGDPPLVVITSNSERRLPEPFLRRCIFHHIELTQKLVEDAVEVHRATLAKLGVDGALESAAINRFFELRGRDLRKKPATGELLLWLAALGMQGKVADDLSGPLAKLPALSTLVKDKDDLQRL